MKIIRICLPILITCLLSLSALASELPSAPDGYIWIRCNEINGAFLMPYNWYFKQVQKGETLGYFFTRENLYEQDRFKTGLTVNVVPNLPDKAGMSPSEFAATYIKSAVSEREVYKKPWAISMGPFEGYGIELITRDKKEGDFITHHQFLANDRTGTLYIIIFESSADSWKTAWKIAEPMLQSFQIDETF